jgi:hypothetical protein
MFDAHDDLTFYYYFFEILFKMSDFIRTQIVDCIKSIIILPFKEVGKKRIMRFEIRKHSSFNFKISFYQNSLSFSSPPISTFNFNYKLQLY